MALHRPGAPLVPEDRPSPHPLSGQAVIRVLGAGVCHSDVHMADGVIADLPLPRVLGHEIAGHDEELGNVLVYGSWGDGTCAWCERGLEQLCEDVKEPGWSVDGGYAEKVLVPDRRFLIPLAGLDPVKAAPLADAGVTPYRAVRRVQPWLADAGACAIVLGAGGLGQFAIQYLRLLTDARVVVVDPSETKRETALALGAHEVLDSTGTLPRARAILDLVGTDTTLSLAVSTVSPTGIVAVLGESGGRVSFGFGSVPHEAHLTTSVWGSAADLHSVLELAHRGEIRWEVETLPLGRANEALDRLRRGEAHGRLVLVP